MFSQQESFRNRAINMTKFTNASIIACYVGSHWLAKRISLGRNQFVVCLFDKISMYFCEHNSALSITCSHILSSNYGDINYYLETTHCE